MIIISRQEINLLLGLLLIKFFEKYLKKVELRSEVIPTLLVDLLTAKEEEE
jgi:hypothetical protein